MNNKSKQSKEKLRGGYYTPLNVADFLAQWISEPFEAATVLEPSAGDGVFLEALADIKSDMHVTAVELLDEEVNKARKKVENDSRFSVIQGDFYEYYIQSNDVKYDAIVGNPPYIRYQFLTEEQRLEQSDILINNGMKPNKLTNAWMAFTIASIEMLKENGRIGFVLPTDLLQVSYAKQLRYFLLEQLKSLTLITFKEGVFEGIQQDVVLLLGEKHGELTPSHELRIINLDNANELIKDILNVPFEEISAYKSDKWTKFFLSTEERNFYENSLNKTSVNSFNDYIKGEIGITTGNNSFFVINNDMVNEYSLGEYTLPILGRSVETKGILYKQDDIAKNIEKGKNIWLLDFNGRPLSDGAQKYIKHGEENGEHIGYKLGLREEWYEVPSIWTPQAFMLRRIGEYPKVVINDVEATSTDTFHRLIFHDKGLREQIVFLLYSSPALLSFELEGRIFGGGALEILPGDLVNIIVPELTANDLDFSQLIIELDGKFRDNESIEDIVLWVDGVIGDYSILSKEDFATSFEIWKVCKHRRTGK